MASEITKLDSLVYDQRNGVPWHRLGESVSIDMTATQAAPLAFRRQDGAPGIWAPCLASLGAIGTDGTVWAIAPDQYAIVRDDTRTILGVVTKRYKLRGPEHFVAHLDALRSDGVRVDVMGSLRGGATLWASLNIDQNWSLIRRDGSADQFATQLLVTAGIDGETGFRHILSDVRAVCANTIQLAVATGGQQGQTIRHTGAVDHKLESVRSAILSTIEQAQGLREVYAELDRAAMSRSGMVDFGLALLHGGTTETAAEAREAAVQTMREASDRMRTRTENILSDMVHLFDHGVENGGASRYDALNAVTQYIDHAKARGKDAAARIKAAESATFGVGSERKRRALELLTRW